MCSKDTIFALEVTGISCCHWLLPSTLSLSLRWSFLIEYFSKNMSESGLPLCPSKIARCSHTGKSCRWNDSPKVACKTSWSYHNLLIIIITIITTQYLSISSSLSVEICRIRKSQASEMYHRVHTGFSLWAGSLLSSPVSGRTTHLTKPSADAVL